MTTIQTNIGTKFNFKLDNGLPYKPTLQTTFKLFSQKNNKNGGIIKIFIDSDLKDNEINILQIKDIRMSRNDFWLDVGNYYIFGEYNNDLIYQSAENRTLIFKLFYKDNFVIGAGVQ